MYNTERRGRIAVFFKTLSSSQQRIVINPTLLSAGLIANAGCVLCGFSRENKACQDDRLYCQVNVNLHRPDFSRRLHRHPATATARLRYAAIRRSCALALRRDISATLITAPANATQFVD